MLSGVKPLHNLRTALAGSRCLVLGGGGFIGANLSNALAEIGAHVHAYGRRLTYSSSLAPGIRWSSADFRDRPTLAAAMETADFIFHLASASTPTSANADPVADVSDNVITTLHLLEICRRQRSGRIIFISSGGTVYGVSSKIPIPETAPTNPISAYGIQKLAVEKYLALYNHLYGLDYRVLRVANPFGPLQLASKNQGLVAALMRRALKNEPIEIWGSGEVVRDFIYIDDVVRAVMMAAVHEGPSRLFNVGSGVGKTVNSVIDDVERAVNQRRLQRIYLESRSVDVPVNVLDIRLIVSEVGWVPEVTWTDGLRKTLEWMERS
jgi:UDP-glucose 4-epimerase